MRPIFESASEQLINQGRMEERQSFAHRLQQRGESYDSIASLVNVDVGTVRQWLSGK